MGLRGSGAGPPAQRQLVRGLAATSLQDPQKGSKMMQNWVKITGFEQGPGAKGRYIVTFGQEAVRGPQKWSKMSIFLLKWSKIIKNHEIC